jgi:hypothetical protein
MMGGSSLTFSTFSVPNAGTELAMVRQDLGMNGSTLGPVRVTISTGRAITGEMLSYSSSGSPLNTLYIDAAGNMNLMYTPAVELATPAHYVVQWKNIRAMVAQPNPAFTSKDISFSVNAGGATVTITGVDLALTTAAKKVLSVNVGSKNITAITKTATSIKFVIPTAALAGVVGTPTAQIPSSPQMVSINLGSGATVAAGTITYVGADKLAQTISNTTAVTDALVGDADRTIAAGVTTLVQAANPVLTPTATPATVCTVVANKVHFVGSGVCTVTAASAANSYLAAGTTVTKTITVRKPDTITVTMGDIQTDDSVDGFQVPAAATSARTIVYAIDPSSSTVCRYDATSGAVIGSKTRGSGNNTCKVNLTIAQDATWSAASTQQVLTISNEPETGTAPSAPKNITNSITNAPVTYKYMQYIWNRTTGSISMKINSTWIGPNTVKISWSQGGTNYTCTSAKFGTTAKVAAALVNATKTFTSANFCAAATAATKTALKNIAADTVVKVELTRELHFPATYALRAAAFKPAAIYITLGN